MFPPVNCVEFAFLLARLSSADNRRLLLLLFRLNQGSPFSSFSYLSAGLICRSVLFNARLCIAPTDRSNLSLRNPSPLVGQFLFGRICPVVPVLSVGTTCMSRRVVATICRQIK